MHIIKRIGQQDKSRGENLRIQIANYLRNRYSYEPKIWPEHLQCPSEKNSLKNLEIRERGRIQGRGVGAMAPPIFVARSDFLKLLFYSYSLLSVKWYSYTHHLFVEICIRQRHKTLSTLMFNFSFFVTLFSRLSNCLHTCWHRTVTLSNFAKSSPIEQ